MKRRCLAIVFCLTVALSCFAFAGCGDGKEDKAQTDERATLFALSTESYADMQTAIQGYITAEFAYGNAGNTNSGWAEYVRHESKGEASVQNWNVTEAIRQQIVSVEKLAVTVNVFWFDFVGIKPEGGCLFEDRTDTVTQSLYVCKCNNGAYRYAVLPPELGERATNSYINAITDVALYENCKIVLRETEEKNGADVFDSGYIAEVSTSAIHRRYFGEEACDDVAENLPSEKEAYLFVDNGDIICAERYNATSDPVWELGNKYEYEFDNMQEAVADTVLVETYLYALDYPRFWLKSTKDGLNMTVVGDLGGTYTFRVEDNKIVAVSYQDDEYKGTMTITDFGKVTVTVPDEVKALA